MFTSMGMLTGLMWTLAADPVPPAPTETGSVRINSPEPVLPKNGSGALPAKMNETISLSPKVSEDARTINRLKQKETLRIPVSNLRTSNGTAQSPESPSSPATQSERPRKAFAFDRLPDVVPVPESTDPGADLRSDEVKNHPEHFFDFPNAAYFPQIQFGQRGDRIDQPGVIIYEGMRFAVDCRDTTRYDVTFTVTIPERPVTLYLQLTVADRPMTNSAQGTPTSGDKIHLTLPPIYIEPKVNDTLLRKQNTFNVHVSGNSMNLSGFLDAERKPDSLEVHRRGVARFTNYRIESLFP